MMSLLVLGLPQMEALALIGLLGIASVAAWTSATLWQRQRAIEREVSLLSEQVRVLQSSDLALGSWHDTSPPSFSPLAGHLESASPETRTPMSGEHEHSVHWQAALHVADQLLQTSPEGLRRVLRSSLDLNHPAIRASTTEGGQDAASASPWHLRRQE